MAAALLLLLLVSACTAELGFQPKRQYTYLYEAKQASGIPGLQSQWSALGLKMKVVIQVPTPSSDTFYIKLQEPQQSELRNVHTHQPWRKHISMQYSPVQQYQEELSRVFKVRLNGGVITKFTATQGEPIWVVNIKKSIAQLFQMDLPKHQSIEMPGMAQPRRYQSGQEAEFFRVMEDSIGGECETLYETTPHLSQDMKADMLQELSTLSRSWLPGIQVPEHNRFQPFVVTKTKNYQNCKSRPNWQHMTPGAVSCRSDDCYLTASNRSASARYVLDGDRNSFKIQYVVSESEALMFPFGHETEQLWTVTNQTLFLQRDESMRSYFGEPQHPKSYEKLAFQYPTADSQELRVPDLKSAPQMSVHIPGAPVKLIQKEQTMDQLIAIIKQTIQKVDQQLQQVPEPVQEDVTGYVVEIERALSWLSYDQMDRVYGSLTTQAQKDIYWDILALTGTNPAVMKIIDGISANKIEETRLAHILATLPINIKTPTNQLIEELFELFKSPIIQSQTSSRMTMALSLGNIFYQVCVSNTTVEHSYTQGLYQQHFCSSQTNALLKEQFIPFLENKIEGTQEPEKLAYIQALGNTGDRHIISVLRKIMAKQTSPVESSKAIYAFYRVVAQNPEGVRKIMLPIFHDVSKPTDVRMAAVTMLLATNPPIAYWQKIATSTWYEPSNAMVSLIHSTYSALANITIAQVRPLFEMSRRARITLPLARPPKGGFSSYNYRGGHIIPQYQLAALTYFSMIASKTSSIPSVLYYEVQEYINSIVYSSHRWSLHVQGGQRIIDDIMGVGSNVQRGRQSPRDIRSGYQQLENFMSSLRLFQQEPEKFQASLYAQVLGAIDAFITLDEDSYNTLVQRIRQGSSWSANRLQKIAYLEDTTVTFASEIGMPVIYSKKMPMVASVRGQLEAKWSLNGGQYQVTLQNVQPFFAVKSLITVSTVSPFSLRILGAGVENKAQLSLPMSLKAKLDIQSKKLQVEVATVQQPSSVTVAHIQTFPFTTAVKVTSYENLVWSPDTKEITTSQKTNIKVPFGKTFGVEGYLQLVSDSPIMNFGTFWKELKKRGPAVTNFWLMMGSLRSRHYDVVIDTARSNSQKLQTTFGIVSPDSQDKDMPQPVITNKKHIGQVRSVIQKTRQSMQEQTLRMPQASQHQRPRMDSKAGYVVTASILEKNGNNLHYNTYLVLTSDSDWYNQKLTFKASSKSSEVCLDAEMAFPTLSDSRTELLRSDIQAPVWAKLGYGATCQDHTLAMQGHVKRDEVAEQYAKSSPETERCVEHERRGNPSSADCRLAKNRAALANYFELEFTENNLTPGFLQTSYDLDNFVKYLLWPYMKDDHFAPNPSNKVDIKMQLNPVIGGMSLHVYKPSATTKFDNVQLPFNIHQEPGLLSMRRSIHKKLVDNLYGIDKTVCIVDRSVVKTFDNVTLERQLSDCWTLLTGDSSRTRNMAIFEKLENQRPMVRIIVDDKIIDFDASRLGQFKINGQVHNLSPLEHFRARDRHDSRVFLEVLMLTRHTLKVKLPEHYVKLLVTDEGVQIHPSVLAYRGRMRGVCGDFDGEEQYDLVGPDGCIHKTGQEFYDAYHVSLDSSRQCRPARPLHCIRRPDQRRQSQQYNQNTRTQRY